jgi:hypothetical protein
VTVYQELVLDGLAQLSATRGEQTAAWGGNSDEMTSFVEAVETLFDDSGLSDALLGGPVYSPEIDEALAQLQVALTPIDPYQPLEGLVNDPSLTAARAMAARLLALFKSRAAMGTAN